MSDINNTINSANYYILNIYFGKKDFDLHDWVNSVPKGLFSYYVREAIRAYLKNDKSYILPIFEYRMIKKNVSQKPLCVDKEGDDLDIFEFITSIEGDKMRSFTIKNIIRMYLNTAVAKQEPFRKKENPQSLGAQESKVVIAQQDKKAVSNTTGNSDRNASIVNKLLTEGRQRSR